MKVRKINQETRVKILLSAKKEFASLGFAGARMDSIARDASVNKAMLHYYFNSKESLYTEVMRYLVCESGKFDFSFNDFGKDLTSGQKLHIFIHVIINVHFELVDRDFHRIVAWDFAEGKNCMKMLVKDFFSPILEQVEEMISEGVRRGEFQTTNPMLDVWSLIIVIINYINHREIYENTSVYPRLYGENPQKTLKDYLLNHFFKSLSPGLNLEIPAVSSKILEEIDNKIKKINHERNR